MIWLARIPVVLAIGVCLFFNASYAFHAAATDPLQQAGFVAMAVAVDLCKATFLGAAAWCFAHRHRTRALLLLLLWPLAFGTSTFMGYSAIATNFHASSSVVDGAAGDRTRTQERHDRSIAALRQAQAAPEWGGTAACTSPKTKAHRDFCAAAAKLQQETDALARQLGTAPTRHANPQLTLLAAQVNVSPERLVFWIALLPALLLELIASLGSYAVGPPPRAHVPLARQERFWRLKLANIMSRPENAPGAVLEASRGPPVDTSETATPAPPKMPRLPSATPTG